MTKQIIAVDDASPGACSDVGITYDGVDTVTSSSNLAVSGKSEFTGEVEVGANKLNIYPSTGNLTTTGTITSGGNFSVGIAASINAANGNIATDGNVSAVGNITANGVIAFGSDATAAGHGTKIIPVNTLMSLYTTDSTSDITGTLADGISGQMKIVKLLLKDTNNLVVTPANFSDGSTITLDATGELVALVFVGTAWELVYTNGTVA